MENEGFYAKDGEDDPSRYAQSFPDTGHALHWEQPEKFTEDLLQFIASTPA